MLYIFLDESGNLDFSVGGSRYFILSAMSVSRSFPSTVPLMELKYDLWEGGLEIEYFHASEDRQATRNAVFEIISKHSSSYRTDSVIVEKRKTHPTLQSDHSRFYKKIFDILLHYVLEGHRKDHQQIIFVCDVIPLNRRRKALEKAIKLNLAAWAKTHGNRYSILFCSSKSEQNLQVVDYISWAIYRKWEQADQRSYRLIQRCMRSEFDVFQTGANFFY